MCGEICDPSAGFLCVKFRLVKNIRTMVNVHNGLDRYEHFLCTLVFEQVYPALFCYAGKAFGTPIFTANTLTKAVKARRRM